MHPPPPAVGLFSWSNDVTRVRLRDTQGAAVAASVAGSIVCRGYRLFGRCFRADVDPGPEIRMRRGLGDRFADAHRGIVLRNPFGCGCRTDTPGGGPEEARYPMDPHVPAQCHHGVQ